MNSLDFLKIHRIVGFGAAVVTYSSFVLMVYLFFLGLDPPFLEAIYQAGLVILVFWSTTLVLARQVPLRKRIIVLMSIVFVLAMTAIFLGEDMGKVFFLRLGLLHPKISFFHGPDWSPVLVASIYVVAILGTTLVSRWKTANLLLSTKNVIYLCTCSTLAFAPQVLFQNRADGLMEHWYQFLLSLEAPKPAPRTDMVILTVRTDQLVSDRLETLLDIVNHSSPRMVALVSNDFYGKVRVSRAEKGRMLLLIRQPSEKIDPFDPWTGYGRNTLDHGSWMWSSSQFSVYYRPRNDDIGLKTVLQSAGLSETNTAILRSPREVVIGSMKIPLIDEARSIIKYYDRRSILSLDYTEWFERDTLDAYVTVWSRGWVEALEMRLNHQSKKLEILQSDPILGWKVGATPDSLAESIPELRGKIVLIEYSPLSKNLEGSFGDGFMYANIIQNIREQDFLNEPDRFWYVISSLLFVTILFFLFRQWSIWRAVTIVLVVAVIGCGTLAVAFFWLSVLVNPCPILIFAGGGVVGFMPVLFLWERKGLFAERSRLSAELRTAHDMQMGLMPKEDPIVPGFDISGICLPANEVGGDFFDYVWLDQKKTKLGIAVADVSGKAMKAAITAVMTSGMIYREVGQNESPKAIMRKINKPMYAKLDSRMFTALSFAMIDTKKKELRFSNAGQAFPVLKRGKEVVPLEVKGARLPLGVKEDVPYNEMIVKLKKNDTVIFYTDGIPEAKNEKDEFYGFDRFNAIVGGIEGESAKETRDRILEDVKSFTGKSPQYDDMTVVVVKVQG